MKLSTIVTAAVSSAVAVTASPMHKREVGGILMCTGVNATGTCDYKTYDMDKCHQLAAPFHQNVNTFAPDGEAFECFPRVGDCGDICTSPTGCTFGAVSFDYEHKYNLGAINWDKLLSSFDCSLKTQ